MKEAIYELLERQNGNLQNTINFSTKLVEDIRGYLGDELVIPPAVPLLLEDLSVNLGIAQERLKDQQSGIEALKLCLK